MDYDTPKSLADHLLFVASNPTAYNEYFKWKEHVVFRLPNPDIFCSMCISIQQETIYGIKKGIVEDLGSYWNYRRDCRHIELKGIARR